MGNPAAVCPLEANVDVDDHWMQSVAKEFNVSNTAFLSPAISAFGSDGQDESHSIPRFNVRWFTRDAEVPLCGHATLATAYFLFISDITEHETIEFVSKSGLLVAIKINKPALKEEKLTAEIEFPAD